MAAVNASSAAVSSTEVGRVGQIPVRNLWLLMLYASELFRHLDRAPIAIEENPDDIPDLVAEILVSLVERRLKRNLSFGYQTREAALGRVRGRILLLETERRRLRERGKVACRFDELTVDTTRNRFVRSALDEIAPVVTRGDLARRCRSLAASLRRIGVAGEKPSRSQVSADRFGRHEIDDRQMVAAARLAFDLALPAEYPGTFLLFTAAREPAWVYRLYEKAVAGFYKVALPPASWRIEPGRSLGWLIERESAGMQAILPSMVTDIVLEHRTAGRIIIDTKFNPILTSGWYRPESLRSGHIYQMYSYLRSQEGRGDSSADLAAGLLLHPVVNETALNEAVVIQGHQIRFATVDLGAAAQEIRNQLLAVVTDVILRSGLPDI